MTWLLDVMLRPGRVADAFDAAFFDQWWRDLSRWDSSAQSFARVLSLRIQGVWA